MSEQEPNLLAPVSELQVADHEVYARILGAEAIESNIILGED